MRTMRLVFPAGSLRGGSTFGSRTSTVDVSEDLLESLNAKSPKSSRNSRSRSGVMPRMPHWRLTDRPPGSVA